MKRAYVNVSSVRAVDQLLTLRTSTAYKILSSRKAENLTDSSFVLVWCSTAWFGM